jgi:hypothetical protein
MSKPEPARYRRTNWSAYNAALRKRRSLLILLDKEKAWRAPHEGLPGHPPVFSCTAIQFCLSIKREGRPKICPVDRFQPSTGRAPGWFKLPLRQTARMVASFLLLAGLDWPVPERGSHVSSRLSATTPDVMHKFELTYT